MSSGSSGHQPWSIVARCDPADGEIITAHGRNVQILLTFFGADVLRQRSEIAAAVRQAAGSDLDNKFLERVLEAANASVRAARPLNSNQGASIAIAYQDANHELTSLALGKCQLWLSRGGDLESANAYPDIYLGESGFNAGRQLAPQKTRVEPGQKPRAVLAPAGYNPSPRPVRPGWLTLLVIFACVAIVMWRMGTGTGESPSTPTPTLPASEPAPIALEPAPTPTPGPTPTLTKTPVPVTEIQMGGAGQTTAQEIANSTPTPLPTATATFTPAASQSPEPGVTAGVGITPTITLADIMPQVGSYDSLNFGWTQSGDLTDPYLLEVVIWLNGPNTETPSTDLNCFLTTDCGKGISAPEKKPPQNVPLEQVSQRTNMVGFFTRGARYSWTVFVVIPDAPETPANEYKRIAPVNLVGFNGRYPEFEFKRASEEGNERPELPTSPPVAPPTKCVPGQNC